MEIITLKNPSRKPYIYKVTNLETHQYYIGSQCSGKIVGVNYFTSSTNKEFREDFKNCGEEKYKIEIIEEFDDPKECVDAENYMIRDHMQLKDGLCLNRSYVCSNGEKIFSSVGIHHTPWNKGLKGHPSPNKGIPRSDEVRKKISEAHKGIHHSDETRKKIGEAHKGTHRSDKTRKKMSEARKGIPSPRRIKISIEDVTFDSFTEASKYYDVGISTIRY